MVMHRAFYRCDGCPLELHLLGPHDRPCPNCGGNFIETEEPIQHPMQAIQDEMPHNHKTRKQWAALEAAKQIDGVMAEFEKLLAEH